jgi:hypothetical protein
MAILHEELKYFRGFLKMSLFHCSYFIKQYQMVFQAGLRDPCTCDVAWLSKSVKMCTRLRLEYFYAFRKSRDIPRAWITQSCTRTIRYYFSKTWSHIVTNSNTYRHITAHSNALLHMVLTRLLFVLFLISRCQQDCSRKLVLNLSCMWTLEWRRKGALKIKSCNFRLIRIRIKHGITAFENGTE